MKLYLKRVPAISQIIFPCRGCYFKISSGGCKMTDSQELQLTKKYGMNYCRIPYRIFKLVKKEKTIDDIEFEDIDCNVYKKYLSNGGEN